MDSHLVWKVFLLCVVPGFIFAQPVDKKCKSLKTAPIHQACDLFGLITKNDSNEARPCTRSDSVRTEQDCLSRDCCWYQNACFRKPAKCYADFRMERCPFYRRGWQVSSVFTGYSINGTNCFIESIQSYLDNPERFWGATSAHGIRILFSDEQRDSCVKRIRTNATKVNGDPDGCTVAFDRSSGFSPTPSRGTLRANKCVIGQHFFPFDLGVQDSCLCYLDSWMESKGETLTVSNSIRNYVEDKENKTSCAQILGRLVRSSWRNRMEIVNNAEADVVISALLNITNKKTNTITTHDANVLLDTSSQLSKYKFYDGLENDSADFLIQSSAKFLSNIMKSVTSGNEDIPMNEEVTFLGPAALREDPADVQTPEDLQWKVMDNLEGIAENAASLIQLPNNVTTYVVDAQEDAVNIQVSITKPESVTLLKKIGHSTEDGVEQDAHIIDTTSYDGDENVAVITVFYDVPQKKITSSQNRASGILAINLRTVDDDMVQNNLSLPVLFTLRRSKDSCNGTCDNLCSYAERTNDGTTWKQTGCYVAFSDENTTTCSCNHTTHFAVLMQPYEVNISEVDTQVLEFLSIVMGSISVAALAATTTVFFMYRRILLKDRMLIHLHLIIGLMCGYISFLVGSIFSKGHLNLPTPCFASAIANHFFFLSAFFWFLMEGIYLFYKVVLVFSNKWAEWVTKYAPVVGWGAPAIIVATAIGVSRGLQLTGKPEDPDSYYSIQTCFLQMSHGMVWAFMGPALAVIMVNCFILTKVVIVIFRSSFSSSRNAKSTETEKISGSLKNSAKGAIILLPILGVPWIVNVSMVAKAGVGEYNYVATIGAYIHVVLMGIQGVAIFLFYCVFNTEVRMAYKLSAERRRSLASIESGTKNRKRSRLPLLTSKDNSPESTRYKNSLTVSASGRTLTGISQLSSSPPSPNLKRNTLPMVEEHKC